MMRDPGMTSRHSRTRVDRAAGGATTTIIRVASILSANPSRRRIPVISPVMPTYGRWDVAVERGEGCYLYATDGRKFLDFTSGIAVTSLGHCHPHLIDAVTAQAQKLWHCSNLFQIPGQQRARRAAGRQQLRRHRVLQQFRAPRRSSCRSRSRANTRARPAIPSATGSSAAHGSFHGRSFATLAAAGAEAYLKGFGPVMDGFDHVAFNNLNEMRAAVTHETAASWSSRCRAKAACARRRPII